MPFRIDDTYFTTKDFRYDSFGKQKVTLQVSGTLSNNTKKVFRHTVTFTDSRVQARCFVQDPNTGLLAPFTPGQVFPFYTGYEIYEYGGTEDVFVDQHFEQDGALFVITVSIFNTSGGNITLIDQDIDVFIEFYEAPVTWG